MSHCSFCEISEAQAIENHIEAIRKVLITKNIEVGYCCQACKDTGCSTCTQERLSCTGDCESLIMSGFEVLEEATMTLDEFLEFLKTTKLDRGVK